ncbi:hypothetical protein [Terricaulis sp.]|uniref:hypothetical protein n=1 Tax=Terricaulis sp. TaxID=2768686 RepID=UPI0037844813
MHRLVIAALVLLCWAMPASAQELFSNPFADAAAYRTQRGDLSDAHYRVRYEQTLIQRGGAPETSELMLDVADDWALMRNGVQTILYDFRINRVFTIAGDAFVTRNAAADVVFRITERQNRSYLERVLAGVRTRGGQALPGACDAESELGVVVPSIDAASVQWRERRGGVTLRCGGQEIGSFTPGDGAAPPPAFWPTMYAAMPTHPAILRRVRENGHPAAQLENSFISLGTGRSSRAWRLIAIETVTTPYPLTDALANTTAGALDAAVPGAGQVGIEAVAGRAQGGAPTLANWDARVRALAQSDGEPAAAMMLGPMFNMFPDLNCGGADPLFACGLVRRVRSLDDPAPRAFFEIAVAEQQNNPAAAIAAMQRAQVSPLRDHPALGAAYALAMLKFNRQQLEQARAAGLPTDGAALQNRALLAFPYNPGYWTDVGDRFGSAYEWPTAFIFYDVAFSLPLPGASAGNPALQGKRSMAERIRHDFPDAFLPAR